MAITPEYLLHRLRCENCYAREDDDYSYERARHWQKRRRVLGLVLAEVLHRREEQTQQRNMHRTYLTCSDLNPSPCIGTPWQLMHARGNDCAFITTMGINVATFEYILAQGFAEAWNSTPIPRNNVSLTSIPCVDRRSLDAAGALGLILHYLTSTMHEISLQQIFGLIPSTVTQYLSFSHQILLQVLRKVLSAHIEWPRGETFDHFTHHIVERHDQLLGTFSFINGLKLPVEEPSDQDMENTMYNGWLHNHYISNILVFAPDGAHFELFNHSNNVYFAGTIIACRLNAPGSWHDSRVAQTIYEKLWMRTPNGFYLVADTAFPCGNAELCHGGFICAPMKAGETLHMTEEGKRAAVQFDNQLLSCRQAAEWGMQTIQGSFGRLRMPLPVNNVKARANLIETCVRLSNVCTCLVGISQIKNVFMPIWKEEDDGVWDSFETMLFGQIRQKDRVSRFHLQVDEI
jgi:hypothetical protein